MEKIFSTHNLLSLILFIFVLKLLSVFTSAAYNISNCT